MTIKIPKYRESYVVSTVDKYCIVTEFFNAKPFIITIYDQLFSEGGIKFASYPLDKKTNHVDETFHL